MSRLRLGVGLAMGLAASCIVAGCSAQPALDGQTGSAMQARVVAVASSVAAGDPVAALTELESLENALLQATAEGRVSSDRSAQIRASIELVRQDLQAIIAANEPPVEDPVPEPATAGSDDSAPGQGSVSDSDRTGNSGNSESGGGNGTGNNGNGPDRNSGNGPDRNSGNGN